MNSKELANLLGCGERNIRKHTKTAYENNKNYISIKGKKFSFVLVQNDTGKAYEYERISDINKENKNENSSGQISQDNRIQARRETAGADTTQEGQQTKDGSYGVGTLCGSELVERSTCEGTNSTSINALSTKPRKTSEAFLKASLEKRKEAELKLRLVREYESRGKMTTKRFLKELSFLYESLQPSEGKLFRWVKAYREAIREDMNPLGKLLDSRGLSEKPKALSKEMMEDVARMLLENPDRRAKKIEKFLHDMYGSETPEYTTITRYINRWKEKNVLVYEFAKNPDATIGKYRPAYGSASEYVSYANQLWELDATPADIITSDGKRHTLSAAIDVFSRRVVVVLAESASYSTLGRVMKKGILKLGVPECVKTDNGADYTSNYFDYTCARLRINHELVPPYMGWKKPHIERFFRTLSTDLFEELDGYCGHSTVERQAIQNRQTFEHKLQSIKLWRAKQKDGDEFAKKWAIKKENRDLEITLPISKDELANWIDGWIEVYENRLHRGIKTTPLKLYGKTEQPIKRLNDERVLDILVGATLERKVQKNGINVFGLEYVANELWAYSRQRMTIYTDDNLGYIYVYDMEQNFICRAENPELLGKSRIEYMEAGKAFDRAARKIYKALRTLREDAPQRMQKSLVGELLDIGIQAPKIEYKDIKDELREVKDVLNETEPKREIKNKFFESPYERFMYCLERDIWDELSLKLKEKCADEYERACINHKIFNTA